MVATPVCRSAAPATERDARRQRIITLPLRLCLCLMAGCAISVTGR